MQKPKFVTFTGLDAWTDLERVRSLSKRFPVEWGVLASRDRSGVEPRYADLSLYKSFASADVVLALHLCGSHARNALSDGHVDDDLQAAAKDVFDRVQFNVPGGEDAIREGESGRSLVTFVERIGASRGIVQCRGEAFPPQREVDWLFDRSGGRGEAPAGWPAVVTSHESVGYAGGLGPDNVSESVAKIAAGHPDGVAYWIDMESRIRKDDRLDLDACEAVLVRVYGAQ